MSTRANIAIQRKDGTVETVYNHSDGYPSYLGDLLLTYYTDKEDADKTRQMLEMILNLGDISFLDKYLQNSRFYNTWRNEETTKRVYSTLEEFNKYILNSDRDYVYVWNEETAKWKYAKVPYDNNATLEYNPLVLSDNIRHCSECGKEMWEGFCIGGGLHYYCSETCLHKNYTEKEYNDLYDDGNSDTYWTTWEE